MGGDTGNRLGQGNQPRTGKAHIGREYQGSSLGQNTDVRLLCVHGILVAATGCGAECLVWRKVVCLCDAEADLLHGATPSWPHGQTQLARNSSDATLSVEPGNPASRQGLAAVFSARHVAWPLLELDAGNHWRNSAEWPLDLSRIIFCQKGSSLGIPCFFPVGGTRTASWTSTWCWAARGCCAALSRDV